MEIIRQALEQTRDNELGAVRVRLTESAGRSVEAIPTLLALTPDQVADRWAGGPLYFDDEPAEAPR